MPTFARWSLAMAAVALAAAPLVMAEEAPSPEPSPTAAAEPAGISGEAGATPAPTPSPTPNGGEIVDRAEKAMGFQTKRSRLEMTIKTPWRTATYGMWVYSEGSEKTLVKFVAPASFRQTGFLRLGPEQIWVYTRQSEKVLKVTPNLIRSNFQGSDFSNEEFLKQSFLFRFRDNYDATYLGETALEGQRMYVLELKARTAAAPYTRLKMWVRADNYWPKLVEFYDRDQDTPLKSLQVEDVQELHGRLVATRYVFRPTRGETQTQIRVLDTVLDEPIAPQLFTLQYLEKGV